jgi:hypothetical protein
LQRGICPEHARRPLAESLLALLVKMTDKIGRQMIELSKWAAGRLISQPVDLKRA